MAFSVLLGIDVDTVVEVSNILPDVRAITPQLPKLKPGSVTTTSSRSWKFIPNRVQHGRVARHYRAVVRQPPRG